MSCKVKRYVLCYPALFHHLFQWFADRRRMVINLFLGIYIAQAEDEEFSVVYAV